MRIRIFIAISLTYKINIKLTDVDMNVQHKSSIYKFVRSEGEEGKKASLAPQISAGGVGGEGWGMAPLAPPWIRPSQLSRYLLPHM